MKCFTLIDTFDANFDNRIPDENAYVVNFSNKEDLYTTFLTFLEHYHCMSNGKAIVYNWESGDIEYTDPRKEFEAMLVNGYSFPYRDEVSPMGWGFILLRQEEINGTSKVDLPWD